MGRIQNLLVESHGNTCNPFEILKPGKGKSNFPWSNYVVGYLAHHNTHSQMKKKQHNFNRRKGVLKANSIEITLPGYLMNEWMNEWMR